MPNRPCAGCGRGPQNFNLTLPELRQAEDRRAGIWQLLSEWLKAMTTPWTMWPFLHGPMPWCSSIRCSTTVPKGVGDKHASATVNQDPALLEPDNLHPNPEGTEVRAELIAAAKATEKANAKFLAGDWCKFCPAAAVGRCEYLTDFVMAMTMADFTDRSLGIGYAGGSLLLLALLMASLLGMAMVYGVGGIERFHALYKPLLFDVLRLPPPDARLGDASHHLALLERALHRHHDEVAALVELGLHHEQQHQELLLMDIKHVLSCNPTRVAYRPLASPPSGDDRPHDTNGAAIAPRALGHTSSATGPGRTGHPSQHDEDLWPYP